MFPERDRVQDICSGVPWRLDDELVRRRGGLAERLRGVGQLSLQSSTFCVQKSDNEAINLSEYFRTRARCNHRASRTAARTETELKISFPVVFDAQQRAVVFHQLRRLRSRRARFQDSRFDQTRLEQQFRANFNP